MRKPFTLLLTALLCLALLAPPALAEEKAAEAVPFWDVSAVAERIRPSVVGIVATWETGAGDDKHTSRGSGTGIVYRKEGYIITNAHVVDGAKEAKILVGAKTYTAPAASIWLDDLSDVAVIKIPATDLAPATLGDSDQVLPGQLAIAVGNPLGLRLGNTVSVGVISGVGRSLGTGYPFLQTDAAVNPGNSGGPLVNARGQVIGINTIKMVDEDVEGLAFAIPINLAKKMADRLITEKKIVRAWLGVELLEGSDAEVGLPTDEGLWVRRIRKDGPAANILARNDEVVALNDRKVHTLDDAEAILLDLKPGALLKVTFRRKGKEETRQIGLVARPPLGEEFGFDDDVAMGIWRELDSPQIAEAFALGRRFRGKSFEEMAKDYMQSREDVSILIETEYLYFARRYWAFDRKNEKYSDNQFGEDFYRIRGNMEITVAVNMNLPEKVPNLWGKVQGVQGNKTWECKWASGQDNFYAPLNHPSRSGDRTQINVCLLPTLELDPTKKLTLKVNDGRVGQVEFEFDLMELR
ncbi:MAG TPA: trypsin-like peptidase domain-containing protein [Symbiobacteriaceae bacterium]|nr:trypsin-like peptidase domain-containing protein [Symbiobacteriaceae bacterium]